MLYTMRHLEIHVIETEQDIELALQSGVLSVDRLDSSTCSDCQERIGYNADLDSFEGFAVIIDEDDEDWAVCLDCSSPVISERLFDDSDSLEWLATLEAPDDDLEKF